MKRSTKLFIKFHSESSYLVHQFVPVEKRFPATSTTIIKGRILLKLKHYTRKSDNRLDKPTAGTKHFPHPKKELIVKQRYEEEFYCSLFAA